ncbi:MAG: glycoside hydrolase family 127 protein [Bifidobacteriaceae bacterium]|jgi:DUF1680 family protein|nr:glycoside hydrolase family 127 protein [Bifidobacteriaceae bacterium]
MPRTYARELAFGAPVAPGHGVLRPLGLCDVTIDDGFWAERQRVNGTTSIPHALAWEDKVGWVRNFVAAGAGESNRTGKDFSDSDVYKLLEAMVWESARLGDEALEREITRLAGVVAAAQAPDGYLNTHFGRPGLPARYSDFEWGHELYCYGHLFQAAVARIRCGHEDQLVEVALRAADHVCRVFGVGGTVAVCGHPEIEVGLVELGRATGRTQYIDQARLFIERRGHGLLKAIEWGQDYFQDDLPVRAAAVFRGHAVRAGYLAAGAVDVAVETGDQELLTAVRRQYDRTLARRTYLTGGMGSRHTGEAFGEDFELPPDRAYCETCAAIASVMVAWRLLLATGEEKYADVIERTAYNAIMCSPSLAGDAFFYANPLQLRWPGRQPDSDEPCPRAESGARAPWFTVSCCPPNVARFVASFGTQVATVEADRVRIHQFASGEIRAELASGHQVRLDVRTGYPADGRVEVTVLECDPSQEWSVALRVPGWAEIELDGLTRQGDLAVARGRFRPARRFVMDIDLAPRVIHPDPRIDAIRGCVAVERGPLVLCLESTDLPEGFSAEDLRVDVDETPVAVGDGARIAGWLLGQPEGHSWPYLAQPEPPGLRPEQVRLIPYRRWGNRGPSTMRVWLPRPEAELCVGAESGAANWPGRTADTGDTGDTDAVNVDPELGQPA